MTEVESSTLNHTATLMPCMRLICVETEPKGDEISDFDLCLVQPNENAIPTGGLHTIEHLLASLLRGCMEDAINYSPFGHRTRFHPVTWRTPSVETVARALVSSLEAIVTGVNWQDTPGTGITSCGNYRDHSLFIARERCKKILEGGFSTNPSIRTPLPEFAG